MECVEAVALKSSRKEMVMKQSPQVFLDESSSLWGVNVQNGLSCDDLFVDELLDFSNEDGFVVGQEEEYEEEEEDKTAGPASVSHNPEQTLEDKTNSRRVTNFSAKDDFVTIPASELCVPADDVASLEWLSHFVEDSNSEYSTPFPVGALPEEPKKEDRSEPEKHVLLTEPCFKTPVPGKARSKRTRTGVRVWPLLGSPSLSESSSSSSSSTSSSSPSSPWLIFPGSSLEPAEPVWFEKPGVKKLKKTQGLEVGNGGGGGGSQPPRRCSHCGVQKTPQWRTGPLGAKTLCNACGVRYKSGRLLPEYRPACSPTFSSEIHSNHHRKVLEMRKKKEAIEPEPVVPSFG